MIIIIENGFALGTKVNMVEGPSGPPSSHRFHSQAQLGAPLPLQHRALLSNRSRALK